MMLPAGAGSGVGWQMGFGGFGFWRKAREEDKSGDLLCVLPRGYAMNVAHFSVVFPKDSAPGMSCP